VGVGGWVPRISAALSSALHREHARARAGACRRSFSRRREFPRRNELTS